MDRSVLYKHVIDALKQTGRYFTEASEVLMDILDVREFCSRLEKLLGGTLTISEAGVRKRGTPVGIILGAGTYSARVLTDYVASLTPTEP